MRSRFGPPDQCRSISASSPRPSSSPATSSTSTSTAPRRSPARAAGMAAARAPTVERPTGASTSPPREARSASPSSDLTRVVAARWPRLAVAGAARPASPSPVGGTSRLPIGPGAAGSGAGLGAAVASAAARRRGLPSGRGPSVRSPAGGRRRCTPCTKATGPGARYAESTRNVSARANPGPDQGVRGRFRPRIAAGRSVADRDGVAFVHGTQHKDLACRRVQRIDIASAAGVSPGSGDATAGHLGLRRRLGLSLASRPEGPAWAPAVARPCVSGSAWRLGLSRASRAPAAARPPAGLRS